MDLKLKLENVYEKAGSEKMVDRIEDTQHSWQIWVKGIDELKCMMKRTMEMNQVPCYLPPLIYNTSSSILTPRVLIHSATLSATLDPSQTKCHPTFDSSKSHSLY
ncbi:hypothetical protein NPIL_152871 [Nephila pilipes]|uniref:Uncharacterized protein n=1 Tax=Nephila pilipes TaxID=299642 RepID=A0A8X6UFT1_NEPPI|nr:hypothetical protein NPIL_152871 [Nephila pilipes]